MKGLVEFLEFNSRIWSWNSPYLWYVSVTFDLKTTEKVNKV